MPPSADTTSNLLKGLKIVQSLSEAVPHGGILKAVAGVGITILETVERARVNREECFDIARRAAEHISVLKRLRTEDGLSDDLGDSLERYRRPRRSIDKSRRFGIHVRGREEVDVSDNECARGDPDVSREAE
ncbi:hypothetical protein SISNIDRAFT_322856 [Sistotremastrum niveocremeum HHB9708]|uniref:Uncharacterized protein n=1 Tax=Sistotremastrum niveocremeum HHB9708 TaxID=1314777 RepID=A0A164MU36_9AGAM|nr:hypothetical protein SISNIDRAFT_322856 [Sistotremastrum niveocremeum HHB9708]